MMASSSSSSSQAAALVANRGVEDEKEKPRLTDREKKANHIASEQKRRQAIREGFDRLSVLVPGLEGQARSEGVVLHTTLDYLRELLQERRALIESLEAAGVDVDAPAKRPLETLPAGWIDQQSRTQGSRSGSPAETNEREDARAGGSSGSPEGS